MWSYVSFAKSASIKTIINWFSNLYLNFFDSIRCEVDLIIVNSFNV